MCCANTHLQLNHHSNCVKEVPSFFILTDRDNEVQVVCCVCAPSGVTYCRQGMAPGPSTSTASGDTVLRNSYYQNRPKGIKRGDLLNLGWGWADARDRDLGVRKEKAFHFQVGEENKTENSKRILRARGRRLREPSS